MSTPKDRKRGREQCRQVRERGRGSVAAYALADAGFDVWLASGRGSKYGKKHAQLDPGSTEFWDFSSVLRTSTLCATHTAQQSSAH